MKFGLALMWLCILSGSLALFGRGRGFLILLMVSALAGVAMGFLLLALEKLVQ